MYTYNMAFFTIFTLYSLLACSYAAGASLVYRVQEEQPAGSFIGSIVVDSKLYENVTNEEFRSLTFVLYEDVKGNGVLFFVNKTTSVIRTAKVLDRETICEQVLNCTLELNVYVYTNLGGNVDLKTVLAVLIILEDINDNAPIFPQSLVTQDVQESIPVNQEILLRGAKDLDAGNNSIQSYEISRGEGMFGLNVMKNSDGTADLGLIVKHALDHETKSVFEVEIIARDGGRPPKTGQVKIQINVLDENDNKPQFTSGVFEASVPENSPVNLPILQVAANDPDSGVNSELTYSFTLGTSKKITDILAINSTTGVIYPIKPFDYEAEKTFKFFVQVTDNGSPRRSDQAEVNINVEDVNDNAPTVYINHPPGEITFPENTPVDTFIAQVSVSDKDHGENGAITCEIPDKHFFLERFSNTSYIYRILLHKQLDYEEARMYVVNVTCQDRGNPVKIGFSSFEISVTDVNDNAPIFTQSKYTVSFMENNQINSIVLKVTAEDRDGGLNGKVSYVKLNDPEMFFSIESETGVIRANTVFNREVVDSVTFKVLARDFGSPEYSATVDVLVIIGDVNDHSPFFNQPHFNFYVRENKPIGTTINILNVTDLDSPANSKLIFKFTPDSERMDDNFFLRPDTGHIKTSRVFDREKESKFDFSVTVTDAGNPEYTDTAQVTVYVLDENDNYPVIHFPNAINKTVYIPYIRPAGTAAVKINATDADIDKNGELTYSIQKGNKNDVFFMNPKTGEIIVSRTMSLADSTTYNLMVAVQDKSYEPKITSSELNLIVTIGNGSLVTYASQQENREGEDNSVIVIAIAVVTIVLAIAIVILIVVVRRRDRKRKNKEAARKAKGQYDSPKSESTFSTSEGNDCDSDKQLKPERLHTLESVSSDGSSSHQSYPYGNMEQSLLKSSGRNGSTQSLKGRTTPTNHITDPADITSWLANQPLKGIPEDSTSQVSGGTDRDSGRGASEEDSKLYHSDPDEPKIYMSPYNNGSSKRVHFVDNNKNGHLGHSTSGARSPVHCDQRDTVSRNIANSLRSPQNTLTSFKPKKNLPPHPPRMKYPYPPSSYSDIYNNSISESINEDNCSTTTSGSYSIDSILPSKDSDRLFFSHDSNTTVV